MESFRRVPSVLKRLLIEIFAVLMFSVFLTGLAYEVRPDAIAPQYDIAGGDWLYAMAGPLLVAWVLWDIIRPKVKIEGWIPFIGNFDFCSTHPSYILIDILTIVFAAFFYWLAVTARLEMAYFRVMMGTAFFFPVGRLVAWYALGLKIDDRETIDAYKPPLITFGIFAAIIVIAVIPQMLSK